ncbi:ORF2 [Halorubrum pleomorphic virus 1]|uniref:Uncharacterized protein 2 n=1 Tax=Halorubrum pleomorphic virus 1 TaxID=634168 RepID=ORF2_HAPV1|nr:hypothetical protein HRPV-1_gp2 [Halorubrum pleomorphic virus 1]C1JJY1.1 RecName: Full=Uncharacterized protein 2 [Halorubrum pleomorphic virus 1]ACO54897.1 ORF2 [Halorubrum pleomorphic virus 1]
MSKSKTPNFDDMEVLDDTNDEYDDSESEWIDLDRGESVVGEIREINPDCGDYGTTVLELSRGLGDNVCMWSNRQIDNKIEQHGLGVGEVVGIKHTDREQTFTPDGSDEPVKFDVYEVRAVNVGGND